MEKMKVGTAQAYNKQVGGSLRSPKLPSATSHTHQPLYAMLAHYYLTIGLRRDECS